MTTTEVRLWLDDERPCPDAKVGNWVALTNVDEAIGLIEDPAWDVVEIDTDYYFGRYSNMGGNGDDLCWYLRGHMFLPRDGISFHSSNMIGNDLMAHIIEPLLKVSHDRT